MPEHMKKRLINRNKANVTWHGNHYSVPIKILEKYKMDEDDDSSFESIEEMFSDLIDQFGEPAVILKGIRAKEGLSQIEFAEIIGITQQNLSAMENGRRNIGKELAKRIAKEFNINYRLLL